MYMRIHAATLMGMIALRTAVFGNEPILEKATLEWHGHAQSPVGVSNPWRPQIQVGPRFLDLEGNTVIAHKPGSANPDWTSTSKERKSMVWLGQGGGIAYIWAFDYDPTNNNTDPEPQICRIDAGTGEWLSDLSIPGPSDSKTLLGVLPSNDSVFVLTSVMKVKKDSPTDKGMAEYRVTRFDAPSGNVKWTELFSATSEFEYGGPYLLASKMPLKSTPNVNPLSFLGDDILVCAGPRQAVVSLDRTTGKQKWKLENVWEFERGFVGPSVWRHFISRFGINTYWNVIDQSPSDPKISQDFYRRWSCEIIGGPIVVPRVPTEWNPNPASIFVAISKAPADGPQAPYSSYLSDCVVYEISSTGNVVGTAMLPRLVNGGRFRAINDGVVWACQHNAFVRLVASGRTNGEASGMMGYGGSDMLTCARWYREFEAGDHLDRNAWLVVDTYGDEVAFSNDRAFRATEGGYVRANSKREICFPLSTVGYEDGKPDDLVLRVPLKEDATLPTSNFSGENPTRSIGPYLLAINGLTIEGNFLAVTLGNDKWAGTATFEIPPQDSDREK